MATTTSNFGWPIPQSTDLVKDGATAIASLGSGVDTSMAELKGGTTGQILSKTSNTDMDFTWVTPNPGDITGVTAGTGITGGGTSGDVTVSFDIANYGGGQGAAGKNLVLNGAFDIWQRGTSIAQTAGANYTADRWQQGGNGTPSATISRQATSDSTNLPNIQYCARVQRNSSSTNTTNIGICQSIETINSIPFAGKNVVLSFYARKGSNFSATSSNLAIRLVTSTTTDQNILINGGTNVFDSTATLTTTWQRFTFTGSIPTTAATIGILPNFNPTGTAGAADYFEITGIQLEVGSTATPFMRNSANIQGELAACQRYYSTSIPTGYTITDFPIMGTSGAGGQIFWASGTSDLLGTLQYPVPMRGTPTLTAYSGNNRTAGNARDMVTGTDIAFTPSAQTGNNRLLSYVTVAGTATSGRPYGFQWTASAEL